MKSSLAASTSVPASRRDPGTVALIADVRADEWRAHIKHFQLASLHMRIAVVSTAAEVEQRLGGHYVELILCGHSHVARSVRTVREGLIVNPGSVGLQAYQDDYPHPHVVESGSPDARYAIVERGPFGWTAAMLTVPYLHQQMAELAPLRRCPDWERALLTGYAQ